MLCYTVVTVIRSRYKTLRGGNNDISQVAVEYSSRLCTSISCTRVAIVSSKSVMLCYTIVTIIRSTNKTVRSATTDVSQVAVEYSGRFCTTISCTRIIIVRSKSVMLCYTVVTVIRS